VPHRDARVIQAARRGGHHFLVRDGHGDQPVPARRVPGAGQPGERGQRARRVARVQRPDFEHLTAGQCLQLPWRAAGDGDALVHHHDLTREPVCFLQVLRREQHSGAVGREPADHLPQLVPASQIQPGRRLVQEQHGRPADEARRQVEPAAHPAGVLPKPPASRVGETEPGQQFRRPGPRGPRPQAEQPADQVEVLGARDLVVDGGVLAGEPDAPADLLGVGHHVVTEDAGAPGVRPQQRGQDPDRGGLAGSVRPEQPEDGPCGHLQVQPAQHRPGAEGLAQVLGLDREHVHWRYPSSIENLYN
jgi:hypothetical protein